MRIDKPSGSLANLSGSFKGEFEGTVRYDMSQSLSDTQKAQARQNIGVEAGGNIGDGRITIKQGTVTKGTFTVNQTGSTDIVLEDVDVAAAISTHNLTSNAHSNIIAPISSSISAIEGKIPTQATAQNKLADKNFVNSSIATSTATFRGTFDCTGEEGTYINLVSFEPSAPWRLEEICGTLGYNYKHSTATDFDVLKYKVDESSTIEIYQGDILIASFNEGGEAQEITLTNDESESITLLGEYNGGYFSLKITGSDIKKVNESIGIPNAITWDGKSGYIADNNDYLYLVVKDSVGNKSYERYKYSDDGWQYEYTLNNSSFTANQWAAINSGITAGLIPSGTTSSNKLANAAQLNTKITNPASGSAGQVLTKTANGEEWQNVPSEVFVATYGVTPYADVLAAYNAGKICMCKYDGYLCYMVYNYVDANRLIFCGIYFNSSKGFYITPNNVYHPQSINLETSGDKEKTTASFETNKASTTKYPSNFVVDSLFARKTTEQPLDYSAGQSYTLTANKIATLNASTAASGDSITIALPASPAVTDCFDIQITLGANVPTINFPSGSKWLGGSGPSFSANSIVEINVMNGLWVAGSF